MRTQKNLSAALVLLLASVICSGCATYTPPERPVSLSHVFEERAPDQNLVIKDATELEDAFIRQTAGIMTPELRAAADKTTITVYHANDVTHFEDTYGGVIVGHYHTDTKQVCLRARYLDRETVWHELAHAYNDTLSEDFDNEWQAAAGDVYKKDYDKIKFPYHGVLKKYGASSYLEDIATWEEDLYCFIADLYNEVQHVDKSDPIYLKKLDILLKWKFINEEDYNRVRPKVTKK